MHIELDTVEQTLLFGLIVIEFRLCVGVRTIEVAECAHVIIDHVGLVVHHVLGERLNTHVVILNFKCFKEIMGLALILNKTHIILSLRFINALSSSQHTNKLGLDMVLVKTDFISFANLVH